MKTVIGVLGLGYVGLPLALAFARQFEGTVGFDIDRRKIAKLVSGQDPTDEGLEPLIRDTSLRFADDASALGGCNFFVVTVPTPVDENHNPDLRPLKGACEVLGPILKPGATVVFESTVYPGLTEEVCGPWLEQHSGLKLGKDIALGYSPERMNPGDKEHTVERIVKVVAGSDAATLELVASVYEKVVTAGVHRASSIKVAEAAKVIENTQRDLNIALMNELAIIFDRIGIPTRDVLAAARTKWNFLPFTPGLVGGHCIGVDPYYLTTKAEQLKYHPQVILSGRRINDGMGAWVAQKVIKLLVQSGTTVRGARVGILGLTFKENVRDIRNSRVPDIIRELNEFGAHTLVHDPGADGEEVQHEYGISLCPWEELTALDALVLAVSHREYVAMSTEELLGGLKAGGLVVDVKSMLDRGKVPDHLTYWSV
jgi:UDP-N-acetyl-D-galactosamine dehydrogenase